MKLRLVLKTTTKKGKDALIKLNIAPSKHLGFINFVNLALNQNKDVKIYFEKISKTGEVEVSKVEGVFKFQKADENQLRELEEEIKEKEKQRKKLKQKRKYKA
ncbi:MAG: hypothetical protein ACP6IY_17570 [Promethearchaeia archaeon]